jgi:hypothetical protein
MKLVIHRLLSSPLFSISPFFSIILYLADEVILPLRGCDKRLGGHYAATDHPSIDHLFYATPSSTRFKV